MPTGIPAAKRPARKAVAVKPAAKKAAANKGTNKGTMKGTTKGAAKARQPPPALSADDIVSLRELAARLGKLEVTGLAGSFVQGWRADLKAIVQANRKSYAGLRATAVRQIKDAAGEVMTVGTVMRNFGAKESVRHLNSLAIASLHLALEDIRELAGLASNSQRETFEIVHARATKTVEKVERLLRK